MGHTSLIALHSLTVTCLEVNTHAHFTVHSERVCRVDTHPDACSVELFEWITFSVRCSQGHAPHNTHLVYLSIPPLTASLKDVESGTHERRGRHGTERVVSGGRWTARPALRHSCFISSPPLGAHHDAAPRPAIPLSPVQSLPRRASRTCINPT